VATLFEDSFTRSGGFGGLFPDEDDIPDPILQQRYASITDIQKQF
jgi:hypothetical protein